jgi:tetratricopeptide (TPR) repeat protein
MAAPTRRSGTVLPALVLIATTWLAYAPVLRAGFVWDDDSHITADTALRSVEGLRGIWLTPGATMQYYPLTFSAWWAAYHMWGLDPRAYHAITLVMHIAASLLLWRVLARLGVRGSWLGAMLFAIHPVNVMSVAWATELKNTLSLTLALGSLAVWLRWEEGGRKDRRLYALSLAVFAAALLAKTAVGVLPLTILLLAWWKRGRVGRRDLLAVAPMIAAAIAAGAVTAYVERHSGGAAGPGFALPVADRLIVSGRSFWFYLGKLVVPYPLVFTYERWTIDATDPLAWLWPLATAGFLVALFALRGRIGRGPFAAVAHFYLATSALVLFVILYMTRFSYVSDHWQYFGAIGIIALASAGASRLSDRLAARWRPALAAAIGLVVVALAGATRHQTAAYREKEKFYRTILSENPSSWMASFNLANALAQSDRGDEAIALYRDTLRLRPDYAEAHLNLGGALSTAGHADEAIEHLTEAERLSPAVAAQAEFNIADIFRSQGRLDEAIEHYREAVRHKPEFVFARNNLGYALSLKGRYAEAIEQYEEALKIAPDADGVRKNLSEARAALAKAQAEAAYPRAAVDLHAQCVALQQAGRSREAVDCLRKVVAAAPDSAEAHNDLGVALASTHDLGGAFEEFREAVRLAPDSHEARENLKRVRAQLLSAR